MASNSKQTDDSTADLACTRCRERKIRCGRERPECGNCERDGAAKCVYKQPTKRVNHIKLLCKSVERLHDRFDDMQSNISRSAGGEVGGQYRGGSNGAALAGSPTGSVPGDDADDRSDGDDDEDEDELGQEGPASASSSGGKTFQDPVDNAARWHGPSSLYSLCARFCQHMIANCGQTEANPSLAELLKPVCENAGRLDGFTAFNEQEVTQMPPQEQVTAAVAVFLNHVDYSTDVFVPSILHANIERIYSQPIQRQQDEAWLICFRTIVLMALGLQIFANSRERDGGLFSSLARSVLSSRVDMVNSRLLTTPRLINVQTLILLSVATQRLDSRGLAELLFNHACMLAKTMGLHYDQTGSVDDGLAANVEKAKVMRSLYCRDKGFYVNYGSDPWLSGRAYDIADHLSVAAEQSDQFADRIELSLVEDDIYCLAHASPRRDATSRKRGRSLSQHIERQLNDLSQRFEPQELPDSRAPSRTALFLEFLGSRILAFQVIAQPRHTDQLLSDARASCDMLIAALGQSDAPFTNNGPGHAQGKVTAMQVGELLDAFSLPAFFVLLKRLLDYRGGGRLEEHNADRNRVKNVAECYKDSAMHLQTNSYHGTVAWTLGQLLSATDRCKDVRRDSVASLSVSDPPGEVLPANSASSSAVTARHSQTARQQDNMVSLPQTNCASSTVAATAQTRQVDTLPGTFNFPPQSGMSLFPNPDLNTPNTAAIMESFFLPSDSSSGTSAYPLPDAMDFLADTDPFGTMPGKSRAPFDDIDPFFQNALLGPTVAPNMLSDLTGQEGSGSGLPVATSNASGLNSSTGSGPEAGSNTNPAVSRKRRKGNKG